MLFTSRNIQRSSLFTSNQDWQS